MVAALDPGSGGLGRIISVKQSNEQTLLQRRNVVGVGVGYKVTATGPTNELAVIVNVERKLPKAQLAESDLIPGRIEQIRTDVIETGLIRAFQGSKDRWRPIIPGGVSIGHLEVTAGTLGCLVRRGNQLFILSNNHVLANVNQGRRGDPVIQPSQYDNGSAADRVAELDDYIPIDFGDDPPGCQSAELVAKVLNFLAKTGGSNHRLTTYQETAGLNRMDAALAKPIDASMFSPTIHQIGPPQGSRNISLGGQVKKSGRTTGYTEGRIIQIDVTTAVMYGGKSATFTGQLMADGMSAPGDSGSAVLDSDNYVVGLLFAGSNTTTLINPIEPILNALNIAIMTG